MFNKFHKNSNNNVTKQQEIINYYSKLIKRNYAEIENIKKRTEPIIEENKQFENRIKEIELKIKNLEHDLSQNLKISGQSDERNAYSFYKLLEQVKHICLQNVEQVQNVTSFVDNFCKLIETKIQTENPLNEIIKKFESLKCIETYLKEQKMLTLENFHNLSDESIEKYIKPQCQKLQIIGLAYDNIKNDLQKIRKDYKELNKLIKMDEKIKKKIVY